MSEHSPLEIEIKCFSDKDKATLLDAFGVWADRREVGFSLKKFQTEQSEWSRKNFGAHKPDHAILGVAEEVGELCHSHLKRSQGIRGTPLEHDAKGQDAIGDIVVYLADYCSGMGWDFEDIVATVWDQVQKRDWKKDSLNANPNSNPEHSIYEGVTTPFYAESKEFTARKQQAQQQESGPFRIITR
jgi:NTP pyrophosphatase (non-canonical NTP hydrolase)